MSRNSDDTFTELMFEVDKGDKTNVERLLDKGLEPNQKDKDGFTALMLAVEKGHYAIVELLLKRGSDPNHQNNDKDTALIMAAKEGHTEIVKLLLNNGSKPNQAGDYGDTALMLAVEKGHYEIVKLLLDKGSDPNQEKEKGNTPLMMAVVKGHVDIVELLLNKGSDPGHANTFGYTALILAVRIGNPEIVRLLLGPGVDSKPGNANTYGDTALMMAVYKGYTEIVQLLLGPDVDSKQGRANTNGDTALIMAVERNHKEIVKLLLALGVNSKPEQINYECMSALHYVYNWYKKTNLDPSWLNILVKLIQYIYKKYEKDFKDPKNVFELKEKVCEKPNDDTQRLKQIKKYNNKNESTDIYYNLLLQICKEQENNIELKNALIEQKVDFMHFCNIPDAGVVVSSILTATHPEKTPDGTINTRSKNTTNKRKASHISLPIKAKKLKIGVGKDVIDFHVNHIRDTGMNRLTAYKYLRGLIKDRLDKDGLDEEEANIIHDLVYNYNMAEQDDENYERLGSLKKGGSVKKRNKNKRTIRKNKNKNKRTIRK